MRASVKARRKKIAQNPDQFSFLFQNNPLPMWVYDLETLRFLEVNEAAVKHYGYSRAEFLRMRLPDIRPKEDIARIKAHVHAKRQRLQYSGEWRHRKKDGTLIYVEIVSHMLTYKGRKSALIVAKDITESKRAHSALKESQTELRDVIDSAMDAIILVDDHQRVVLFNPAAEKMFQHSAAEVIGKSLGSLIPQPFRKAHKDQVLKFGKSGRTRRSALHLGWVLGLRADGTKFPAEVAISTVKSADKKFYTAIMRDISERMQAEEALRESEAQYKLLFESAPVGIGLTDSSGKFINFNNAILKPGGYNREDITKIGNVNFLYADPAQRKQVLSLFHKQGYVSKYEVQFKRKDGSTYDALLSLSKANINGKPCIQALVEDITALRASESELRALFLAIPDLIMVLDKDGRYIKIASSNPDLLNQPVDDLISKRMHDIFSRQKADRLVKYIRRALRTQRPVRFEYAVLAGNKIVWFAGVTAPLTKDTVVWVARDITSQKQTEEQTRHRLIELKALYESGLAFGHTMDIKAIGEQIIHVLRNHFYWDQATVRLRREDSNEVELIAFSGGRNKSSASLRRALARITRAGQGLSGWVIEHGETVRVDDLINDARYVETFTGTKSGLYVPMKIGEIAIGVISVESNQSEAFDENDERLLTTLAAQAASAIHNARLFSQTQRRAMESATLYEVTSELAATLTDIPSLLQTIAKDIATMLGVPGGVVHLYDSQRSELETVATTDSNMPVGVQQIRLGEGMTGRIAQSHKPLIIDDYKTWVDADAQYKDQPFYSVLGVPMLYGGELIGILAANGLHATSSTKESNRKFTERDVRLLSLFASAAAGAVYSARLLDSERKRLQEAETLQKAAAALTSSLNTEEILNSLLDGLAQVIPFNSSTVFISEGSFIRVAAEKGVDSSTLFVGQSIPLEDSMGKYVLELRAPLILADAQADTRFHQFSASQIIHGWIGVPLIVHEKVIGYLSMGSDQPNAFNESHADMALAIGNQAATAIENARLFQDAVRYAQRWATLHAVSQELARVSEDLEKVYTSIHNAVSKLLPVEVFTIALLDDKCTSIDAVYLYDRGERSPAMRIPLGNGFSGKVIKSGVSIKVDDDLESPAVDVNMVMFGSLDMARSVLAVPLRVNDKVIGAMSVQSYKPNVYSSEDQLLLELLATQAAIAIENTRLFDEIRQRAHEFEALYQTTHDISLQQDSDSLLQMIVERATNLLHSPIGGFYLYNAERQELELSFFTGVKLRLGTRLKQGEGAAGRVVLTREPILINDYQNWEGHSAIYEGIPFRAVLAVPILYGGELIGVLEVNEYGDSKREYTQNDANLLSLFAAHAAGIVHNARLLDQLKERVEQFSTLHSIDLVIGSTTDLRVSLQVVLESIMRLLKIDAAEILLYNSATLNLEYADSVGFRSDIARPISRLGEGLAGHVALARQMLDIPELANVELPPPFRDMIDHEGFISYRCLPLIAKGEVKGVLELYHRSALPSDPEWSDLLNLLTSQAAIAIDNAMLFNNLEHANTELELAYDATIEGWSQALELRDHETSGHTRRMLDTTIALAHKMGIPDSELPNIRRGVLLHDIGKMGVPDQILLKPGPLNEEEWKIMHQHPLNAYNLLSKIAYLRPALDIPYYHHEKWDGSGYPRGLKGEQIPVSARMFAIVDVFDALSFDRPYRSAWPKEKVMAYIKEQSGKYFDPHVVEEFLEMVG